MHNEIMPQMILNTGVKTSSLKNFVVLPNGPGPKLSKLNGTNMQMNNPNRIDRNNFSTRLRNSVFILLIQNSFYECIYL